MSIKCTGVCAVVDEQVSSECVCVCVVCEAEWAPASHMDNAMIQ